MELFYKGKTKDVYNLGDGLLLMKLKDDGTVNAKGEFDPGGNEVGITIEGMGKANLRLTEYFFRILKEHNIPTHFVSADIDNNSMTVQSANIIGQGIEVICRFAAAGSFVRRYGSYINEGEILDALIEFTLKDDERGDPPITKETLNMLKIIDNTQYDEIVRLTKKIGRIIKDEFNKKDATLLDIKFEFGIKDNNIILIDEISAGSMRVSKNGSILSPFDIINLILP